MSESEIPEMLVSQEIKQGVKDIGEGVKDIGEGILSMSKSLEKLTTGVNGLCKDMGWSIKIVCVAVSAYLMVKTVRAAW